MGQAMTGEQQQQQRQEAEEVLCVKPEVVKAPALPPYEQQAAELCESYVRQMRIVPPLLRSSAGLGPEPCTSEPTLLESIQRRVASLVVPRVGLMEQEALQQQKELRWGVGASQVPASNSRSALGHELHEFAARFKIVRDNATQQVAAEALEIDVALEEVNKGLDGLQREAAKQNCLAEVYEFAEGERRALQDEVATFDKLLRDEVLVLLQDVWSLLSDTERAAVQADVDARGSHPS
ncbi:helicase-like protein [Trypanosoma grayi]|uniref:helicase-like protein n=1 Tax=Trypanosoma grayi TaxID=71804 RepID=UPI0004F4B3BB|nr:helicase-like protein [Trypanosoma grayi]KEG14120.1 helicase-like protein [Trypanosoma grayi]